MTEPVNLKASFIFFLFIFCASIAQGQSPDSLDKHPNILGFELGTKLISHQDLKESSTYKKQANYEYIGTAKTWQGYKIESFQVQTYKGRIVSVTLNFNADTSIVKTLEQLYGEGRGSDTAKEWNGKEIGVSFLQVISIKPVDGKMKMIPSGISVCYYDIAHINEGF